MDAAKTFALCVAIVLLYISSVAAQAMNPTPAELTVERSQTEKRHFAKAHPCPVTQKPEPSCKGYVIDHIVPLCAGGPDKADNMQWQAVDIAKLKDQIEKASCACIRKHGAAACPVVQWTHCVATGPCSQ